MTRSLAGDANDLELPLGRRTQLYRFFEMLPGFLSYGIIILLFVCSAISPILGSLYLLIIVTITLVKAIGVAVRTIQGYNVMKRAMAANWRRRLMDLERPHEVYESLLEENLDAGGLKKLFKRKREEFQFEEHKENLRLLAADSAKFPKPSQLIHAVIMVAYEEGLETLIPTVEAVLKTGFPNNQIIFVLAYESRGGEKMAQNALALKKRFGKKFKEFLIVEHPDNLPNEIKGKGPNLTFAGERLVEFLAKKHIDEQRVIVTSLDADNRMHEKYLDYVAYEFVVHEERERMAFQPVAIFTNNIWEAAAPMRVVAMSNSFFNVINVMRPHLLRNFASHSQPLSALRKMGFWSKRTIVEDGHQYWRSLFYFHGKYEVLSIKVPMYQDAVMSETVWETVKAQFVQLRRWDYGASDVAYVGVRLFDKKRRKMSFWTLFPKFVRLLDGHVTLAAVNPIVAFGGWVPRILNMESRQLLAYNLPNIVSVIELLAAVGLMVSILISLRILPPRPKKYQCSKMIGMVAQWILAPIIAIAYQSAAAFYAQTRLLSGNYMETFDVTRKVVKG